jgi:hypothetical protein
VPCSSSWDELENKNGQSGIPIGRREIASEILFGFLLVSLLFTLFVALRAGLAFLLGFDTALVSAIFTFGLGLFAAGLALLAFFLLTFFGHHGADSEGESNGGEQQRFDELHI